MEPNHSEDKTVYQLVRSKLPMIEDSEPNRALLSTFTWETMHELEPFFRVNDLPSIAQTPPEEGEEAVPVETFHVEHVGNELYYTPAQKSLVSDLVAVQALQVIGSGSNIIATDGSLNTSANPIKRVKAGSVETEFDTSASKQSGGTGVQGLINTYVQAAIRKGHKMGLLIDINADSQIAIDLLMRQPTLPPFIIID